ncbi:MAG: bacteriochlorophyll 4-vinyl reductase [Oceanicaulis sp.]
MSAAPVLAARPASAEPVAGLIGPNTVLQTEAALIAEGGPELARRVFERAGLAALLRNRPEAMIDQALARALFDALFAELPEPRARTLAAEAGRLTGAYILAHRIPKAAQAILKLLPARLAGPMLLKSIARHAWTFAGSGVCAVDAGPPVQLTITGNPIAIPGCVWHAGVLEVLFQTLVSAKAQVRHTRCEHAGARACTFEVAL